MDQYRTFRRRIGAGFVDGLVFLPISAFGSYLSSPARGSVVLISWAIVSYSAYWIYSVVLHARYGQTVGKRIMRIKVLDVSEERIPSLLQAFLRDLGWIVVDVLSLAYFIYLVGAYKYVQRVELLDNLPGRILNYSSTGWFLIEIITMLTNSKRRALHDLIANTVVVRVD